MSEDLLIITVLGKDREGLVAEISGKLAEFNINIVDIEQSVIRGLFSMFMLVDTANSNMDDQELRNSMFTIANKLNVRIDISPYKKYQSGLEVKKKDVQKITILGKDKPGIVAEFSKTLFKNNVNIERIKMIARGELLVMDVMIDVSRVDSMERLRDEIRETGERLGMDVVLQSEDIYKLQKRMVVFDMDGTIIDEEIIDELAKAAGVGKRVAEITAKGMRGEIDFSEGLRERVRLLRGLPVEVMEEIKNNLKLTPECEELIKTLKAMGYKLALISGGFTYFTDALKERFGFDYAFGNELIIKNGKLTGEIKGGIIDPKRKAEILDELARRENISMNEIVAIGDGANDQIMIQNAGLGIALNAKNVLKKVADGSITKNNLKGLLYCLGANERAYM